MNSQATAAATESKQAGNRPADTMHVGPITATIWVNASKTGTFYSVTFGRSYKDGEQWKHSDSFGRDDLLVLAKAADRAHGRVLELQRESRKS